MRKERRKISRQDAIYSLALAGISSALSLLFIWLGVFVRYSTIAFFIAASLCTMVPMVKKYYVSSIFSYIVSSALAFLIVGDITQVIGFILYFGPMGLITGFMSNLKVKEYISLPIKIVYINGIIALLYFVFNTIVINIDLELVPYWMVAVFGTIGLVAVDYVVRLAYKEIGRVLLKVLRTRNEKTVVEDEENIDEKECPFEDLDNENIDNINTKNEDENGENQG